MMRHQNELSNEDTRFNAETLQKVIALACRLQNEHEERLSASQLAALLGFISGKPRVGGISGAVLAVPLTPAFVELMPTFWIRYDTSFPLGWQIIHECLPFLS